MSRQQFHHLLVRYMDGKCTASEKRIVEQWYAMLDDHASSPEVSFDLDLMEQQLWDRVTSEIGTTPVRPLLLRRTWIRVAAAASVSALLVAGTWIFLNRSSATRPAAIAMLQKSNNTVNQLTISLDDGSDVILEPGASLTYPARFTDSGRNVTLQGDGFFTIRQDAHRPFYVFSNDVVIRVLGTSFMVTNNRKTHNTEVTVKTGSVAVSHVNTTAAGKDTKNATEQIVAKPNQRVIYDAGLQKIESTLAEAPVPVDEGKSFVFRDNLVKDVLNQIGKAYAIQIITDNERIDKGTFTGNISAQGLYEKLDLVCESIGAEYAVKGTVIYLTLKCKD